MNCSCLSPASHDTQILWGSRRLEGFTAQLTVTLTLHGGMALIIVTLTIDGREKQLLRLHNLEQPINVFKCLQNHLLLCELDVRVIAMSAIVNDAIHVQVEVIEYRNIGAGTGLIGEWISLTQPSEELWNPCKTKSEVVQSLPQFGCSFATIISCNCSVERSQCMYVALRRRQQVLPIRNTSQPCNCSQLTLHIAIMHAYENLLVQVLTEGGTSLSYCR